MKNNLLVFWLLLNTLVAFTQTPTGWKFGGAVPAIAYDSDVGFRYGALGYIYDWGDGHLYPDYQKSIYLEWSRTTKGSGITRIQYDDRNLFGSKVRLIGEIGYYIEQALDFYGFNGYQSVYHNEYEDKTSPEYKSRMFYRCDRRTFRGNFDFQMPLNEKIKLFFGLSTFYVKMNSVDIARLNKGKKPEDQLPSVDSVPGLFELYQQWGLIKSSEVKGGFVPLAKIGIIYDTRNNEALPTKGLWEEIFFVGGLGTKSLPSYLQVFAAHRQYFNIIEKRLSFAYRIAYEGKIAGSVPYFMMPVIFSTKDIQDGIGGSKTLRGVMRNRIVSDGTAFSTAEIRWRVINTKLFKQDFYIALSAFIDAAVVVVPYKLDLTFVPENMRSIHFNTDESIIHKPHLGYGGGIRFALNENFIVAADYGITPNKQDGSSGLYIGLGWMF